MDSMRIFRNLGALPENSHLPDTAYGVRRSLEYTTAPF